MELNIAPGIQIFADPLFFFRAVENILRNAVQNASGKVLLELFQEGELVRVTVHDDGPGIPEALREKVMVPFSDYKPTAIAKRAVSASVLPLLAASFDSTMANSTSLPRPWAVRRSRQSGQMNEIRSIQASQQFATNHPQFEQMGLVTVVYE